METPRKSASVRLMLSVSGGGDAFGPFFATLDLGRADIAQLLGRAAAFREAKETMGDLYQMTYFDYAPEFFESGDMADATDNPADDDRLTAIFDEGDYPEDGFEDAPEGLPESGNVRRDYCKLIVADAMMPTKPGAVDYHWVACIKHTDTEIATCDLDEDDLRDLLGRLA
jgi:hypothetical protein